MSEFYLPILDSSFTTIKGTLEQKIYTIPDVSASVIVDIPLAKIQSLFQYDSSNVLPHINDISADDIRYYVFSSNFPASNSGAVISDLSINGNSTMNMKGDYISHLARQLFNTERGVDLFNNEDELKSDFKFKCYTFWKKITDDYVKTVDTSSATGAGSGTDDSGRKYLTNDMSAPSNLTRELLLQLVYDGSGTRFQDISGNLDTTTNLFKAPFRTGDKISFILTVHSHPNQTSIIGENPGKPVKDRIYKISLRVV